MFHKIYKFTMIVLAIVLVLIPFCASAAVEFEEDDKDIQAGKMAADVLVVRPLSLAATLIGGGLFIISLPFSALGGNTKEAYQRLLEDPAKYTFARPLGDF
ncbi:MAG: hypothetical protein HKM93_13165 [Desulfobacteraceae bacterium]|nr:hypothetical protein [Desulfobacteraceae bacterium]